MSSHVLLILLNELEKKIKCEAGRAFYLLFATSLIKLINTRERMLDSIYHYDIQNTLKSLFWRKTVIILSLFTQRYIWERSDSVVECLNRDRKAAGSSLTGVTALWSLRKTHLS